MRTLKDCPDLVIIRIKQRNPDITNRQLAELLATRGYTDATHHKVRRRVKRIRHAGGFDRPPIDDLQ